VPQDIDEDEDYGQEPTIKVPEEYLKWRSNPDAQKRKSEEVKKDWVLANFSEDELEIVRRKHVLMRLNQSLIDSGKIKAKEIGNSNQFQESLIDGVAASSVGFQGFGRSLDTTIIQLKHIKKEDRTQQGKFPQLRR
jgi:hypothetical protein